MPPKGPFFDIKKELRTGHKFPLGTFVRVWCVCVCVCMYVCVCVCVRVFGTESFASLSTPKCMTWH